MHEGSRICIVKRRFMHRRRDGVRCPRMFIRYFFRRESGAWNRDGKARLHMPKVQRLVIINGGCGRSTAYTIIHLYHASIYQQTRLNCIDAASKTSIAPRSPCKTLRIVQQSEGPGPLLVTRHITRSFLFRSVPLTARTRFLPQATHIKHPSFSACRLPCFARLR